MPTLVIRDNDPSIESKVPDDIREAIRRNPCLTRIFDAPYLTDAETLYVLDSDVLLFGKPHDFGPSAYMGSWFGPDPPKCRELWRSLGRELQPTYPCLCAGTISYERAMLLENRELAIDFVRAAVKAKWDKLWDPHATIDNCTIAGLWRDRYPDNPLPRERYAYIQPQPNMVLYHVGGARFDPRFKPYLEHYLKNVLRNPEYGA